MATPLNSEWDEEEMQKDVVCPDYSYPCWGGQDIHNQVIYLHSEWGEEDMRKDVFPDYSYPDWRAIEPP